MTARGRFITLEGIDGAGKSTAMATVARVLAAKGIAVVETREPGGTAAGERIRGLLLDPAVPLHAETEALLVFAARRQHLAEVILPALEAGTWVLCDRFTDATFAYQGGGRGLLEARLEVLRQWVQADLNPDLTLLLDIAPGTAQARTTGRQEADRFEAEALAFRARVREAYLGIARREPGRVAVIDAARPLDEVQQQLERAVSERCLAQR